MERRDTEALDATLAALAEPARRQAIDLLHDQPRRAGELAALLGLPRPAMSKHLRVLRRAGLVEESSPDDDARVRLYRLRPERFDELERWLEEVGRFWHDRLAAFRAHVERQK
jgi:DNA-binding transcriptional ArsR family regulator